jgi:hypothetical protein
MPAFQSERLSKQRYAGEMCVCPGRQQLPAAALILEKAIPGTYGGTTTGTVSDAMTITTWTATVAATTFLGRIFAPSRRVPSGRPNAR